MLYDYLAAGFVDNGDYNCTERMLYAANEVYHLNLSKDALRLSAGFGGGMGTGRVCGALTGAIMILGELFVKDHAHESKRIKQLTQELFRRYDEVMGNTDCVDLRIKYRTPELKCRNVILEAAKIVDDMVAREKAADNA
ncbi:MAG: C-GCAxxG-C-C family (seleno)protein [Eubacteriales bacterium]|nr:C-GCAxxG-C-C family (seleno)protein [Eubacteriales bacterium]